WWRGRCRSAASAPLPVKRSSCMSLRSRAPVPIASTGLERYAWLSIATALVTLAIKWAAWWLTGSVGLLSDALEAFVNLGAALMAVSMLRLAAAPPDEGHQYGHSKAEYFSAGIEGALIVLAAAGIFATALPRLIHPQPRA